MLNIYGYDISVGCKKIWRNVDYSFVYFCAGGFVYLYEDKILAISRVKRNLVSIIGLLVSCSLLFFMGLFYTYSNGDLWDVVWNGYDTIFTLFNVFFIYVLSLNYSRNNSFIRSISCNTLGIFLIHALFIRLTGAWMKEQPFLCNFPVCILYAFSILCVCLLVCVIIKKIPIVNKLL